MGVISTSHMNYWGISLSGGPPRTVDQEESVRGHKKRRLAVNGSGCTYDTIRERKGVLAQAVCGSVKGLRLAWVSRGNVSQI